MKQEKPQNSGVVKTARRRTREKKPEPIWTASSVGRYSVEGHDFQLHKISNPPGLDDDPIVVPFLAENVRPYEDEEDIEDADEDFRRGR